MLYQQKKQLKGSKPSDESTSNMCLVSKEDGTSRPLINLKNPNDFVYHHFKQENMQFALEVIQKDDYS